MSPQNTGQYGSEAVPLSEEDRAQMERLSEQATGTFVEMSRIIARTLGREASGSTVKAFAFVDVEEPLTLKHGTTFEMKFEPRSQEDSWLIMADDQGNCIVYEDPPGICDVCPE